MRVSILILVAACNTGTSGGRSRNNTAAGGDAPAPGDLDGAGGDQPGVFNGDGEVPIPVLESVTPTELVASSSGFVSLTVRGSSITCSGPGLDLSLSFASSASGAGDLHFRANAATCSAVGFTASGPRASLLVGTYWAFINEGGVAFVAPTSNRIPIAVRDAFNVSAADVSNVEQGERALMRVPANVVDCDPLPVMSLVQGDTVAQGPLEPVSCDAYGMVFDFVATAPAGDYTLRFVNGTGLPPDSQATQTFVVQAPCGLPQQGVGPGRKPSVAFAEYRSGGANNAMIAAVDVDTGNVKLMPRSYDLATAYDTPVVTTVPATAVQVGKSNSTTSYYGVAWASTTHIGMFWTDPRGSIVSDGPTPIASAGATDFRMLPFQSVNTDYVLSWRDGNGDIRYATIELDGAAWAHNPTEPVGNGLLPRASGLGSAYDLRFEWQDPNRVMVWRDVRLYDGFMGNPTWSTFTSRTMCNRHPTDGYRICEERSFLHIEMSGRFLYPLNPGAQQHPPELAGELYVAYSDSLGGTTYAAYAGGWYDAPRVRARINQPRAASVPPQLLVYNDRVAWVAEHQDNVVVGSLCH